MIHKVSISKKKLLTVVKAPFLLDTTHVCRRGWCSFRWIAPLYPSICMHIYIYIYIYRERERETERQTDRQTERWVHMRVCIWSTYPLKNVSLKTKMVPARDGRGADGKVIIERLCISLPYVETFNSKVIKGFVPELRSRYVFFVFQIPMFYIYIYIYMYICYEDSMYVSNIHVWACYRMTLSLR